MLGDVLMDVEVWIVMIVPILGLIATADYALGLSTRLSKGKNPLWIHTAGLLLVAVAYFVWLFATFDMRLAFATIDYVDASKHALRVQIVPRLILLDAALLLFSTAAALLVALKRGTSILLSVLAAMLGNIGTLVWLVRRPLDPEQVKAGPS
jgi:hypothetical protein